MHLSVLFLTSLFGLVALESPRENVNFDFAWRFYFGEPPSTTGCSQDAFPGDTSRLKCKELQNNPAQSAKECRSACCNVNSCTIWTFHAEEGCWIGSNVSVSCVHDEEWTAGSPSGIVPSSRDYDDSAWEIVDVPHDAMIGGTFTEEGDEKHGYLPANVSWYRKHFHLPDEWRGKSIWIYFEGVFRASSVWMNAVELGYHDSGYTSFAVRLDNVSGIRYGNDTIDENILAVRVEGVGSGWWYEGSGIYRHAHLVATNNLHAVVDGVYGGSNPNGSIQPHDDQDPSRGLFASTATFSPSAEVTNDANSGNAVNVDIQFNIYNENSVLVAAGKVPTLSIEPGTVVTGKTQIVLQTTELWSLERPYLYTLETLVVSFSKVEDSVNTTVGVRRNHYDVNKGFSMNNQAVKWRGFCNHDFFAGVGTGVPDRINLFRAQMLRAVGGNVWRTSSSPTAPAMLDVFDRIGVLAWDENRHFGNNSDWLDNQRDLVRRDRNHPSVAAWSICANEDCGFVNDPNPNSDRSLLQEYKNAILQADPNGHVTVTLNSHFNDVLTSIVSVMGLSYPDNKTFDDFHSRRFMPALAAECCYCPTFRGEEVAGETVLGNFNADCNRDTNIVEMSRSWVVGEMAWTLFDYLGEPKPFLWPQVSSASGSFDLVGFPKASAFWYSAWWLYNATNSTPAQFPRLLDTNTAQYVDSAEFLVRIVQRWDPDNNRPNRTIQVYTNAPVVLLYVNGASQGLRNLRRLGFAEWTNVPFVPGNLTALAMNFGNFVAQHTVSTVGKASLLVMDVDVPSATTGTGTALLLDGQDVGMVHAAIIDAQGRVVSSSHNISFTILSGPGRIIGVGNGDPMSHQPNKASWRSAYHGIVRVLIQVTEDRVSAPDHRRRLIQIDADGGKRTKIFSPEFEVAASDEEIVVEASANGLGTATASIPVSTQASQHGVLTAAKKWRNL